MTRHQDGGRGRVTHQSGRRPLRRPPAGARRGRRDPHPHLPPLRPEPAGRPVRRHPADLGPGGRRPGRPGGGPPGGGAPRLLARLRRRARAHPRRPRRRLERADLSRPAAAQRGLGVVGRLVRGRRPPGRGAAPSRVRQLHLRAGRGRRRAWHRAGLAALHRAAAGHRRGGPARRPVRRIRPRLLRRAHRRDAASRSRAGASRSGPCQRL